MSDCATDMQDLTALKRHCGAIKTPNPENLENLENPAHILQILLQTNETRGTGPRATVKGEFWLDEGQALALREPPNASRPGGRA